MEVLEMENTIREMKTVFHRSLSKRGVAKEKIREREDRSVENI